MSRVASTCSNLWSYREDVAWFARGRSLEKVNELVELGRG
jgi:hypothetical protein